MKGMKNKKAIEFSFALIFSLVVGAVIIFLAVFAVIRLISTENQATNAEVGKQLEVLLSPVETTIETGTSGNRIDFTSETRIYNDCRNEGSFGIQEIGASVSSSMGEKWQKPKNPNRFNNKYIFSAGVVQGKRLDVFVRKFEMPYKVADLIYLWSENDNYCFVNAPVDIREDLSNLNIKGLNLTDNLRNCINNSIKVCFGSSGCDVDVNVNSKMIRKKAQKTIYYDDSFSYALLYAGIFSDSVIYECQLQRLMKRDAQLASLYAAKSSFLGTKGCTSSIIQPELYSFSSRALSLNSSIEINSISSLAVNLREENNDLLCKLF